MEFNTKFTSLNTVVFMMWAWFPGMRVSSALVRAQIKRVIAATEQTVEITWLFERLSWLNRRQGLGFKIGSKVLDTASLQLFTIWQSAGL